MESDREMLTISETMALVGLSRMTVWRLLRDGRLRGYQMTPVKSSPWCVYADSVREFIARREGKSE